MFFFLPFFCPSHLIQSHQIMKMLDDADQNNISDIVSWSYKDARRFAIHDKKAFKNKILPRYLNNIKFTSFTKQMRRWGFVACISRSCRTKHDVVFTPNVHQG